MLLALDIGNTNIVGAIYPLDEHGRSGADAVTTWRVTTRSEETADEFGLQLRSLFALHDVPVESVDAVAIASVVPPLDAALRQTSLHLFQRKALFVEPGVKTGIPILTDNPAEVGADRIANCAGAWDRFHQAAIVVDMGTATKFDVISAKGEFLGGAIAPGLGISAEALFSRAAKLPRVEIRRPAKIVGTGTVDNLQIGLYYGYIGLVDGILERMLAELGPDTKLIATGGHARFLADGSKYIREYDEMLTLTGLRLIYDRNVDRPGERLRRRGSVAHAV